MWKLGIGVFSYALIIFIHFLGSLVIIFPEESFWFKWFRLGFFILQVGIWTKIRVKPFHPLEAAALGLVLCMGLSGVFFSPTEMGLSFFSYMLTSFGAYLVLRELLAIKTFTQPLVKSFDIVNTVFLVGSLFFDNIFRFFQGQSWGHCGSGRWCGLTENPNILGWFCLFILAFSLRQPFRLLRTVNVVLAVVLMGLSESRTALLGLGLLILGVIILHVCQKRGALSKKIFAVMVLGSLALTAVLQVNLMHQGAFSAVSRTSQWLLDRSPPAHNSRLDSSSGSVEPRHELAQWAWQEFQKHPWLGQGFVVNQKISLPAGVEHQTPIDNTYLNFAWAYGLLGLAACVLIVATLYRFAWGARKIYVGFSALALALPPLLVFEDYVLRLSLFFIIMAFFTKGPPLDT